MKKRLQIRDQKQNRKVTLVLWLLLGTFSMVAMIWTAAHKTVVISARSQEQGELIPEYRTEQTGEMQLPMQTDQKADRQICIPLEAGTKAENVVVENHYMEKELWIYIENGRKAFYKERRITGDLNPVEKGNLRGTERRCAAETFDAGSAGISQHSGRRILMGRLCQPQGTL